MSDRHNHFIDLAPEQFERSEDSPTLERLAAAGAAWRRDVDARLPQANAFLARMRQQIAHERAQRVVGTNHARQLDQQVNTRDNQIDSASAQPLFGASAPMNAQSQTQRANARRGLRAMSTPTKTTDTLTTVTPTPPRRRFAGSIATAAALLIVAALVVVLARGLTGRTGGQVHHNATATTASTQAPTATPGNNFSGGQGVLTSISPTDPQIIYENVIGGQSLLRSSDGGKTFTRLPLPSTTMSNPWFYATVSPLNANHVIASAAGFCQTGNSQQRGKAPLAEPFSGGGATCIQTFFSADGGQTWSLLNLPFAGGIEAIASLQQYSVLNWVTTTLRAQGSRLYAGVGDSPGNALFDGAVRLIVSNDGGASWQSADAGLPSSVCDFAPAPTGETVYAITTATVCTHYTSAQPAFTLWRSDNAGASWAPVTTLPTPYDLGMFVTTDGALYINMPKSVGAQPYFAFSPDSFIVSRDGGRTFTRSPQAGAPASDLYYGPGGQLSDGSIVALAYNTTQNDQSMTAYAWKAGSSSWRKVSQTFHVEINEMVVVSHQGSDVVYFADANGAIYHFTA